MKTSFSLFQIFKSFIVPTSFHYHFLINQCNTVFFLSYSFSTFFCNYFFFGREFLSSLRFLTYFFKETDPNMKVFVYYIVPIQYPICPEKGSILAGFLIQIVMIQTTILPSLYLGNSLLYKTQASNLSKNDSDSKIVRLVTFVFQPI